MKNYLYILMAVLVTAGCGSPEGPDNSGSTLSLTAPENVHLNRQTDHSLIFQWDAVSGAKNYEWQLLTGTAQVKSSTTVNTNAIVDGLTKGVSYSFQVRAVAGESVSSWSSAVIAVPGGDNNGGNNGNGNGNDDDDDNKDKDPVTESVYASFDIPSVEEDGVARAFPGAEGGGMYTTGGRGGAVLHVTNLNDSGEGSLRWAVNQSGPRTIVFDVAGVIELQSQLQIKNGDVTIAGQTAPGDGICIKNYTVNVNADNVIIRYLHFRLGDEGPKAGDGEDCIWGRYHSNIIIDHCSMSWSIDECASFYANEYFTLQWCILTESMNDSAHSKGSHGYGGIWGGKDASFHHNMLANHHSRNPRIDHPEIYPDKGKYTYNFDLSKRGNVDLRNLVIYNWGDNSSYGGEDGHFNFVNCYYKAGPDSKGRHYFVDAYRDYTREVRDSDGKKTGEKVTVHYEYPVLFLAGNYHSSYTDITLDNSLGVYCHNGGSPNLTVSAHTVKGLGQMAAYTTTHSSEDGKDAVLDWAGDRLHRDSVDERAVNGFINNTGRIINTPAEVGGWPEYTFSPDDENIRDSDSDGMPNWFEDQFGLDKTKGSDASKIWLDKNGRYTNLEMYLHYIVKDIVKAQNGNGTYTKL